MKPSRAAIIRESVLAAGFALLAYACVGWPHIFTEIPQGTEPCGTVGLFNVWTIGWNSLLPNGIQEYWNAPIFYPAKSAFVFSEAQPLFMLFAPLQWWLGTPAVYNLFLIGSLTFNGLSLQRLCRRLSPQTSLTPIVVGVIGVVLPFVHWQIGVLQLVPVWGIVWTLSALQRLNDTKRVSLGIEFGLSFSVTYLLCNNYGLMLALLLGPLLLSYFGKSALTLGMVRKMVVSAATVAVITGPIVFTQLTVLSHHSFERTAESVVELSAQIPDYTVLPWGSRLRLMSLLPWLDQYQWRLSSGYMLYALAIASAFRPVRTTRLRRWRRAILTMIAVAVVFSVLPGIPILGASAHGWLSRLIPGFSKVRSFMRFGIFAQVGVLLLASMTMAAAELWFRRSSRRFTRLWFPIAVSLAVVFAFVEIWPTAGPTTSVPWANGRPFFAEWLKEHSDKNDAVACFPFPQSKKAIDFEHEIHWMLATQFHDRPIVNGYSGFFPDRYVQFKAKAARFPAMDVVSELAEMGVTFVVVKEDWLHEAGQPMSAIYQHAELQHRFTDEENQISIFSILPIGDGSDTQHPAP